MLSYRQCPAPAAPRPSRPAEGGLPGYEAITWFGLFTTGGTPRAIVRQAQHRGAAHLRRSGICSVSRAQLSESMAAAPDAFADFIRAETAKWGKVVRDANLKIE